MADVFLPISIGSDLAKYDIILEKPLEPPFYPPVHY